MNPVRFGNAFPIHSQRLTGPGTGEQHLSDNEFLRWSEEDDLEERIGKSLVIIADVLGNKKAEVAQLDGQRYLLTNGPNKDTLDLYHRLEKNEPGPQSLEEAMTRSERILSAMNQEQALNDGSPTLNIQYKVRKQGQTGFVYPIPDNKDMDNVRSTFRQIFRR